MNISLTVTEAIELVGRLPRDADYLLAALMLSTGARLPDLLTARVGDLSPRHDVLHGNAKLAIPPDLQADLARHLDRVRTLYERDAGRLGLSGFDRRTPGLRWADMPLFPDEDARPKKTGQPALRPARGEGDVVRSLQDVADALGWNRLIQSNTLRHAYARAKLEEGMPVEALQARLGHRDLMTTLLYIQSLVGRGLAFTRAPETALAA